jgi:TusA-related sulfurtransferase
MNDDHHRQDEPTPPFLPHALLEAADTSWELLNALIVRRLDELASGDVLEITSTDPAHRPVLLAWCQEQGHDCFQMSVDGDHTWFWIKKR